MRKIIFMLFFMLLFLVKINPVVTATNSTTDETILITDFETVNMRPEENYNWDYQVNGKNGPSGNIFGDVKINKDSQFVRSGTKSLKLTYDFRFGVGTCELNTFLKGGSEGIPIPQLDYCIPIAGTPNRLGLWIYGDNSHGEVRGVLRDSTNHVKYFTYADDINWIGWKYVEAIIPNDIAYPINLYMPVRVVSSSEKSKTEGTIYVEDLSAIYGNSKEDITPPTIRFINPKMDSVITKKNFQLEIELTDAQNGVDVSKIRLYLDNQRINDFIIEGKKEALYVRYYPNTENQPPAGMHTLYIEVSDYGNYCSMESIRFMIEEDCVIVYENNQLSEIGYAGEKGTYQIYTNRYQEFEQYCFKAKYNPQQLMIQNVQLIDQRLQLENLVIDNVEGMVEVNVIGMNEFEIQNKGVLFEIQYQIGAIIEGPIQFSVISSVVSDQKEGMNSQPMQGFCRTGGYRYYLECESAYQGLPFFVHTFDEKEWLVDANIICITENQTRIEIGKTKEGLWNCDSFLDQPLGKQIQIQMEKDQYTSQPYTVVIEKNLLPFRIVITNNSVIQRGSLLTLTGYLGNILGESIDENIRWYLLTDSSAIVLKENILSVDNNVAVHMKIMVRCIVRDFVLDQTITVVANDEPSQVSIALLSALTEVCPGNTIYMIGKVQNAYGEVLSQNLMWEILSPSEGIEFKEGKLVIQKDVKVGTPIVIRCSYKELSSQMTIYVQEKDNHQQIIMQCVYIFVTILFCTVGTIVVVTIYQKKHFKRGGSHD